MLLLTHRRVLTTEDVHIDLMRWNTSGAFPSLQLTCVVTSPSSVKYTSKVGEPVYVLNILLFSLTLSGHTTWLPPICMVLVFSALIQCQIHFPIFDPYFVVIACKLSLISPSTLMSSARHNG